MRIRKASLKKPRSGQRAQQRSIHPLAWDSAASKIISDPWQLRKSGAVQILQLKPFAEIPWLVHGFSTRPGGASSLDGEKVLNLSFMEWDEEQNVIANRQALQKAVGAADFRLIATKQIHSDVIHNFPVAPSQPCKGDASTTNQPNLLLATQTADCVPILLVDPKKRAVASIHAGWRGTLARIAQKAVGRLELEYGCGPADMLAAIGPCIGPCCYEVGSDLVAKFTSQFADAHDYFDEARTGEEPNPLQWLNMCPPGHQPPPKNVHLDLRKANRSQLLAAGLRPQNISVSALCSGCRSDLFFSHRKEGPQSGRMLSVIGIKP